ncbi:MAG TPA: type II toxin-antitoxin system VapC family toxin [Rhizomicrobium sp.]|jgi:PIN domain nuclease of toxin-antitoxin system|nr:type II toxin-antitoxin system VapC family toxin [Rhizomicrobium sp.]
MARIPSHLQTGYATIPPSWLAAAHEKPKRLRIDTQLLLWAAGEPGKLPRAARRLIEDNNNELIFSAASLWELAIKSQIGRDNFQLDPRIFRRSLLDNKYTELPITGEHAIAVPDLPAIHKDPFDRMLVAKGRCEGLTLLTADPLVARYPGPIQRV